MYRKLARWCHRRHWTVIGAWLALLVLSAVTYVSFAGALSTNITLPDTPTTRVSQPVSTPVRESAVTARAQQARASTSPAPQRARRRGETDATGDPRDRKAAEEKDPHASARRLLRGEGGDGSVPANAHRLGLPHGAEVLQPVLALGRSVTVMVISADVSYVPSLMSIPAPSIMPSGRRMMVCTAASFSSRSSASRTAAPRID